MGEKNTKPIFLKNKQKPFYISIVVLWIISTIFAWKAFRQPLQIERKTPENRIVQKTDMEYKIGVIPCSLYPDGGIIKPEGFIFTNITDSIKIHINSIVSADRPISVKGACHVIAKLKAEGLWERQYLLKEKAHLEMEAKENRLIEGEYTIKPAVFLNFIEAVEEDTKTRSARYLLTVKPLFEGNIVYNDTKIPLDSSPELTFEITNSLIKLVDERGDNLTDDQTVSIDKREFLKEDIIERTETINQKFNFLGLEFPTIAVRCIFSLMSLLLLAHILSDILRKNRLKRDSLSDAARIDIKYRGRLIPIKRQLDMSSFLKLDSFKLLLKIADDKEQPIFRYEDLNKIVMYYVVDENHIYSYSADNNSTVQLDNKSKIPFSESGV
jgi:hypothetical protein